MSSSSAVKLTLVENSPDLICTHDLDGLILSVNAAACRVLGTPQEALCSMKIQDLLTPAQRPGIASYLQTMKSRGGATGRMSVVTKEGGRSIWEYQSTLRTEGVESPIVRGVARDITESEDVPDAGRARHSRSQSAHVRHGGEAVRSTEIASGRRSVRDTN